MKTADQHTRINNIILGSLERPALRWLATHMPAWVTPDVCTGIGVLGAVLTAVGYGLSNHHPGFLWLASFGFIVNWFGDSLDGTLARYRRIERPLYGYFVDHTTDMISQLLVFIGLGLSPYVNFYVACMSLIGYILLAALAFLRTYVAGEFKISYAGLGPTESRVIAVVLNTAMYFLGIRAIQLSGVTISMYDIPVAAVGLLLFWFFTITAIREMRRLAALGK